MPESIPSLESKRTNLLEKNAQLGDFRSGSITGITGRCGKPNCHCHQPRHPGHGPNLRLTYKVKGKTVSETLANPAALHKAEKEIAEFRRFRQLIQAFVEVKAQICRLRPEQERPDEQLTSEGKKRWKPSIGRSPRR